MGVYIFVFCSVWVCVSLGFLMCGDFYVWVFNVWLCVGLVFLMCVCVCVYVSV